MAVSITCSPAGELPNSQFADKERPDYTLNHTVSASTNTVSGQNANWSVTSTNCTAVTYSYYNASDTVVGGSTDLSSTLTITPGTTSVSISGTFKIIILMAIFIFINNYFLIWNSTTITIIIIIINFKKSS